MNGDDGRIGIRGLRIMGIHGLLPEERTRAQPFEIDLDASLDLRAASVSDALADTVDYGESVGTAAAIVRRTALRPTRGPGWSGGAIGSRS